MGFLNGLCGDNNDTVLWFVILFLLLFWCDNGCGCRRDNDNDCCC